MEKLIKYVMPFFVAGAVTSCGNTGKTKTPEQVPPQYQELHQAGWLIGGWENNSPEGRAIETWEKKNDSTYAGKSYFIMGKDTVSAETIVLEQHGKQVFYIPTVKDQNEGKPVTFTLTYSTAKQLVFENPNHDFPQKIAYTQITSDSVWIEVSGMVDGKLNAQNYPMVKVK